MKELAVSFLPRVMSITNLVLNNKRSFLLKIFSVMKVPGLSFLLV
jgi:hypothetical protein